MPKPTAAEMQQMAKDSRPRAATVRPNVVIEEPSSVQLRIPQPQAAPTQQTAVPQAKPKREPIKIELGFDLRTALEKIANELRARALGYSVSFGVGLGVGLFVLGWYVFPVEITSAPITLLTDPDKAAIVNAAADLAAYDPNNRNLLILANAWPEMDDMACEMVPYQQDPNHAIRLVSLAARMNGVGCQ